MYGSTSAMSRLSRYGSLALAAGGLIASIGCGKIAGIDEYSTCASAGLNGECGPTRITFADNACRDCMAAKCVPEVAACESEPECLELAACSFRCGSGDDGRCMNECWRDRGTSLATAATARLFSCGTSCTNDCFGCGANVAQFNINAPDCVPCIAADDAPGGLCELARACFDDDACTAYLACLRAECRMLGALDPSCRLVCGSRFPEASRKFYQGFGNRVFTGCSQECRAGKRWECRQPTAWPAKSAMTALVTLHTKPTAYVRACRNTDFDCSAPLGERYPEPDGKITFELEQVGTPSYYFEIDDPNETEEPRLHVDWLPLVNDLALWPPAPPPDRLEPLVSAAGARGETLDLSRGIVLVMVFDCSGGLADAQSLETEVSISATPGGAPLYGYPPNPTRLGGGVAFFINLVPNQTTIDVERAGTKIATATVPVRAGAVTWLRFNYPQI
jgi:hypothetical protein